MNTDALFATGKDDWETPDFLFNALDAKFKFTLDVAADEKNHKVDRWLGPGGIEEDALDPEAYWKGRCWLNPPYSTTLQKRFIAKAVASVQNGDADVVVALLPARTDTKVFHKYVWDADNARPRPWVRELTFIEGRLQFKGAPTSAPFPSMIVVFGR